MSVVPEIADLFATAVRHHREGRPDLAEPLYRQILSRRPDHADALDLLGVAAQQAGRSAEAIGLIRRAITIRPDIPDYHSNLGAVLSAAGRMEEAIAAFERSLVLRPDDPETLYNLANAHRLAGSSARAIPIYRRALSMRPDLHPARNNLGLALHENGELDAAIAEYRELIRSRPDLTEARRNLGNALKDTGELDAALAEYRLAAERSSDPRDAGTALYALHFHSESDARAIYVEHARWNERYARPLSVAAPPHSNDRSPERRLRIGYVSPDFTFHPIGRFLQPLPAEHDHTSFEIVCYSDVRRPDALTRDLQSHADLWRQTAALSDEALANQIRADRIDVLVDLTMHMKGSRLMTFARRPAPVQVTWLAYCGTTGLTAMDWRLSDPFLDPPGGDESVYSERTYRLPRTYWCYRPIVPETNVLTPPASSGDGVTFGCLNTFSKVTPPTLAAWIRVLREVRSSRLVIHALEGAHRDRVRAAFEAGGVDPRRIEFVGFLPAEEYFRQYERMDVALDPFPYPGGTTTCDALWTGVPVVSLVGRTAVARAGLSILSNIGLPELATRDIDGYVATAVGLARDLSRLTELRRTLRGRMRSSPLMDAPRYARDVEAAFRAMWRQWSAA